MSTIKSPFKDAVGPDTVPHRGTGSGKVYDSEPNLPSGIPGRDGGLLPELLRDNVAGSPSHSGPIQKSPFKDAVK